MTHLHRGAFVGPLDALTSQCLAVDGQRMQQRLRVIAIGFGAIKVSAGVPDQSPMAVRRSRCALTAGIPHEPLLASPHGAIPMPRRGP